MLAKYEHLNSDLPRATRRQLAVFVLAPKVGTKVLEELFERPLGQTPIRHRAWLWYAVMSLSGLEYLWDEFAQRHNETGCIHHALKWLRLEGGEISWKELSRRLGIPVLKKGHDTLSAFWWKHVEHAPAQRIWTPGGSWDRRNNITRIIVLGESVERDYDYNTATRKLGPSGAKRIERELHALIDQSQLLVPQAVAEAVAYVRRRIPEILNRSRDAVSYRTVSWFFQEDIPHPKRGWVKYLDEINYPRKKIEHDDEIFVEWLPPMRYEEPNRHPNRQYSTQGPRSYRVSPTERLD
jgi:hypothetical protein